MNQTINFVFFGTGPLAESVLASLVRNGYTPDIVVTKPDAMQGRHMQLTAPHIKTWCEMKGIKVLQPVKLDSEFSHQLVTSNYQLFIVASYGKIIPDEVLNIPASGVLNVHPSLLPLYRGPSPIESALLDGVTTTGISIMKLDSGMDHGPILLQNAFTINPASTAQTLEVECGQLGGELLVQVLPHYLDLTLIPKEQDHDKATVCKKITKDLGEITLTTRADEVQRKFRALTPWPGLYFFITHKEKQVRIKVTAVDLLLEGTDTLVASDVILKVVPEGKHEITWGDFVHGYMD
ncbi:TPA: methionyl-tRNA formyltransferase [Candidatus Nomurabacteria bacterium]|nr:methionyl-tRNA formyltransferase [Candidatus Nomurabacteria bacterium]